MFKRNLISGKVKLCVALAHIILSNKSVFKFAVLTFVLVINSDAQGQLLNPKLREATQNVSRKKSDQPGTKIGVTISAKSIDDLPVDIRVKFDQAYKEVVSTNKKSIELNNGILKGDSLLSKALRIRSLANSDSQTIRQEINKLDDGWNKILERKFFKNEPDKMRWYIILLGTNAFKNVQKLADDKEFRPLLAWWAEFLLTQDPPTILCGNEYLKGLLPKEGTLIAKPTQDEYLDIYLKAWERYSKDYVDEIKAVDKNISVPSVLPELLNHRVRNNSKHIICTAYKQKHMPTSKQLANSDKNRKACEKCSTIWPQWKTYYYKDKNNGLLHVID